MILKYININIQTSNSSPKRLRKSIIINVKFYSHVCMIAGFQKEQDRRRHRTHNLGVGTPSFPHLCLDGPHCVGALMGSRWWFLKMTIEVGCHSNWSLGARTNARLATRKSTKTQPANTTNNTHSQQHNKQPTQHNKHYTHHTTTPDSRPTLNGDRVDWTRHV